MKGLDHIILLDGRGGGKPLDFEDITNWHPDHGVLWIHLNYQQPDVIEWLTDHKELNPHVSKALLSEETRPRIAPIENGLLAALRGVNLNPGAEPDDMVSIRLWIESHRIISTKSRELKSTNDVYQTLLEGKGPQTSGDILVALLNRLVWHMSDTVESMQDQIDELEEKVISEAASSLRGDLAKLRKQTITLRRYLVPQRDALNKITYDQVELISNENRIHFHEIGDRLIRHIEDLDVVRERAMVTQEELASKSAEQLNNRMYVLSVVAAIFLPLGFLTGLLGINVGGIPGADYKPAFYIFLVFLALVTAAQYFFFRWKKWF